MSNFVTTLIEVVGLGLIVSGVCFIFVPAAAIVAGVGLILISRGLTR